MKPSKGLFLALTFSFLFISACSTTQQAYWQNIEMYFDSKIGIALSNDDIRKSTVDLIYVRNGERPIATMALGFIENGQYKWLSRDKVIFITENGRLIRTLGLKHNLTYVSNLSVDPLTEPLSIENYTQWKRVIDTEFGDYGVNLSSQFSQALNDNISVHSEQLETVKYVESVDYRSEINGEDSWTNTFWFHRKSGQLLRSSQRVSSQSDTIEITYISRALRLLEK